MQTRLTPYLFYKTETREAMQFYKSVFGGELIISTFKDNNMSQNVETDNLVMHAMLTTESGMIIMASDSPDSNEYKSGNNFSLSLGGNDEEILTSYFEQLSAGGEVFEPLAKAPWGDIFGMLKDKYGTRWMVNIAGQ